MRKAMILVLCASVWASCGSGVKIKKPQVRYLDSNFSAIVKNRSYKQTGEGFKDSTLLSLLYIKLSNIDSICIDFIHDNELTITYLDNGIRNKQSFGGHFTKQGYYEFYFSNKKLEIPPLIPFLRLIHKIDRVRLALTSSGDLIVDRKWDYSTSILLFWVQATHAGNKVFLRLWNSNKFQAITLNETPYNIGFLLRWLKAEGININFLFAIGLQFRAENSLLSYES